MQQWAASLAANPRRSALPIMTHPGIEFTGRTVLEAVTDGEVHYRAVKALSERYPAAASTVIMDLTVEAEAFGAQIHFAQDEVPSVIGRLVSDAESVAKLQVPPLTAGRVPEYLKANRLAAENASSGVPLFGGAIGPFSLAGRLFDMTEIMMAMYIEPETVKALLEKCTEFAIAYCRAIKQAGANGVILAEPAAGLLPDGECREFSSVYVKRIVDAVQDDCFMVILHNCGNRGHCTGAMLATGAAGYHFGNAMDMVSALAECPSEAPVMGNIDPVGMFKSASSAEMYVAVTQLLERTSAYPNFVLSSGCDTPPGVPLANIEAFYKALADYNAKR